MYLPYLLLYPPILIFRHKNALELVVWMGPEDIGPDGIAV